VDTPVHCRRFSGGRGSRQRFHVPVHAAKEETMNIRTLMFIAVIFPAGVALGGVFTCIRVLVFLAVVFLAGAAVGGVFTYWSMRRKKTP
jgi:Flp pilus assembly protein TadB